MWRVGLPDLRRRDAMVAICGDRKITNRAGDVGMQHVMCKAGPPEMEALVCRYP